MPALDRCEAAMLRAFEKEGWEVVSAPFFLEEDDESFYMDLELVLTQTTHQRIILVEVKCFPDEQRQREAFYRAVGQCMTYRQVILAQNLSGELCLALPHTVYQSLERKAIFIAVLRAIPVRIIVINVEVEVIERWINP